MLGLAARLIKLTVNKPQQLVSISTARYTSTMGSTRRIPFSKYHGLGNHFVIVDNRQNQFDFTDSQLIQDICNPRTGVGADCLLELINCSNSHKSCAYEIVNHLASGRLGNLCGNGSRCMVAFARRLGIVSDDEKFTFVGFDGEHWGRTDSASGLVEINIRDVEDITQLDETNYSLNTGCPIHVEFVTNLQEFNLQQRGDIVRFNSDMYPEGANVMFVERNQQGELCMRSYERSINGETWSCGTGTTGVALVTRYREKEFKGPDTFQTEINIRLGKIYVKAARTGPTKFENISLIGPTCHVFDGVYFCT